MSKGLAVLLTIHDGVLRETVCLQLVIAQTHQERANTCVWLEEEDDFWVVKVDRLLTIFHKLVDRYDGLIEKSIIRIVPERHV